MNWFSPWFITSAITGASLFLAVIITWRFPPKKINDLYGYRSRRSKASQEAWDFAQSHSLELMVWVAVINTALAVPALFIELDTLYGVFISLGILLFSVLYLFWDTERALKEKFGE